jgi:hypothetical protein
MAAPGPGRPSEPPAPRRPGPRWIKNKFGSAQIVGIVCCIAATILLFQRPPQWQKSRPVESHEGGDRVVLNNSTEEIRECLRRAGNAREKRPNYRTALPFVKIFSNCRAVGLSWRGALSSANCLTALQRASPNGIRPRRGGLRRTSPSCRCCCARAISDSISPVTKKNDLRITPGLCFRSPDCFCFFTRIWLADVEDKMITAAEYRAWAEESLEWARNAPKESVAAYIQWAEFWLESASRVERLTALIEDRSKEPTPTTEYVWQLPPFQDWPRNGTGIRIRKHRRSIVRPIDQFAFDFEADR